jgi:hypothetical protein
LRELVFLPSADVASGGYLTIPTISDQ